MYYYFGENILNEDECQKLIDTGLYLGFEKATVNVYGSLKKMENIRNNERVEWDDNALGLNLNSLLQEKLVDSFPYVYKEKLYHKVGTHFRMYRYVPEQYFKPHKDGHFKDKNYESLITVLFYLNTTEGGQTILMPDGYSKKDSWITIEPKRGSVLLFDHDYWHEGSPVLSNKKYVLRTDLFYNN